MKFIAKGSEELKEIVAMHNGRSHIVHRIESGTTAVTRKFRSSMQDLLQEVLGYESLKRAGYFVVDTLSLEIAADAACVKMPTVQKAPMFLSCLQGDTSSLVQTVEAMSKQFRDALSRQPTFRDPEKPNQKYFKSRLPTFDLSASVLAHKLSPELLHSPLRINGFDCQPLADVLASAKERIVEVSDLPVDQLAVTHGDPGDLNVFNDGQLIDYEVAGLNDPVSEAAVALHWQLFLGPTFAPKYHRSASGLYDQADGRPGYSIERKSDGSFVLKQPLKHRIEASLKVLEYYGPDALKAVRPELTGAFQERFLPYWCFRALTPLNVSQFSEQDLLTTSLSASLFGAAAQSNDPQQALEDACKSLA